LIRKKFQELFSRYRAYLKANYRSADLSDLSGFPESHLDHSSRQSVQHFCTCYSPLRESAFFNTWHFLLLAQN